MLTTQSSRSFQINDEKIEKAKADEDKVGRRLSTTDRRLSLRNFNGRLSMRETLNAPDRRRWGSLLSTRRLSATAISRGGVADNGSSTLGDSTRGDVEDQNEEEEPKTGIEAAIPMTSLVIHLTLFGYFLAATILTSISSEESRPEFANALFDEVPLGCATAAVFFGLIMCLRDKTRKRFSSVQRGLYSISALILLLACIVLLAMPPSDDYGVASAGPTNVDFATLACLIIYALLAITEGKVCRYPKVATTKEGKKARLNKSALLLILKPYFWPNATATSATLNRIRAATTWICVASSKACSLYSPILLGKASTALTRGDYENAIRYSIFYALTQLASTTLKECQSLVYLRVAQAAFVQLSETAFNHLHSLSLDWHLRKKLGEVIRSMDRGITACDNLMKYAFLWLMPAIAECILVAVIFATYFDYFPLAVSIFFFVFAYITWTILVTLWRKKFRKQVAKSDNDWHDKCTDSLINFETVKYFTAEEYEKKRFGDSVKMYQSGSVNVQASLSFLNISQQVMLQGCLATSLSLAIISIRDRMDCCVTSGCVDGNSECCTNLEGVCSGLEVGDFVSVLTYTLNLFMPL